MNYNETNNLQLKKKETLKSNWTKCRNKLMPKEIGSLSAVSCVSFQYSNETLLLNLRYSNLVIYFVFFGDIGICRN